MMQLKNDHLDVLEGSGSVDQAIEIIKGNIDWMAKNYDEVMSINQTYTNLLHHQLIFF